MKLPKTLNGHPVIRGEDHGNGYATVMVQLGETEIAVATWWPSLKTSWSWGHYVFDPLFANDTFKEVSQRNARR